MAIWATIFCIVSALTKTQREDVTLKEYCEGRKSRGVYYLSDWFLTPSRLLPTLFGWFVGKMASNVIPQNVEIRKT